jgi:NAD(P)-dependent dehydrogenase (short-subunit alcohol dehydrogenase family)
LNGSVISVLGNPEYSAYAASKAGVRAIARVASDDASNVQGAEIFVDGGAKGSPAGAPIYRG